jgi:hypothetical protein
MPTNPTQPRSGQVTIRVVDDIAIVNGRSVRAGEDRDIYQAAIAEVARTYATPAGTAVRARATDRGRTTVLLIQPDGRAEVIQDLDPQPGYTAAAAVATITATVSPAATSHLAHSAGRDLRHRPRNMRCRMALAAGGLVGTAAVVAATVSLTHTPSTSPAAGETTNNRSRYQQQPTTDSQRGQQPTGRAPRAHRRHRGLAGASCDATSTRDLRTCAHSGPATRCRRHPSDRDHPQQAAALDEARPREGHRAQHRSVAVDGQQPHHPQRRRWHRPHHRARAPEPPRNNLSVEHSRSDRAAATDAPAAQPARPTAGQATTGGPCGP